MHPRLSRFLTLLLAIVLVAVACGGSDSDDEEATDPEPTADTAAADEPADQPEPQEEPEAEVEATDPEPAPEPEPTDEPESESAESPPTDAAVDLGRVVVLGEEFLLADVLALGGEPVAATATLGDRFVGIDRDTAGIDPLPSTEANLELLASYQPDLIITTQLLIETVGLDLLEPIAPVAVVDNTDWRQRVADLGDVMGVPDRAAALLASYDDAVADARSSTPADLVVTLATVYVGPSLAVWTDGPTNIPQTLLDLGLTLSPGGGELDGESNGRVFLSNELIPELDGQLLVLSQSSGVEGEDASVAELAEDALWQTLPAVASGDVVTIDRLGYPGVEGRIRLIGDVVAAIDGLS